MEWVRETERQKAKNLKEIKSIGLDFNMIENQAHCIDLSYQNQVYYTRDINSLNSFENVLANKIVWEMVLFDNFGQSLN